MCLKQKQFKQRDPEQRVQRKIRQDIQNKETGKRL